MNPSTEKKSSKLGWNSRVCGRIGIIDYLDINNASLNAAGRRFRKGAFSRALLSEML
jgi:hypothetical protein